MAAISAVLANHRELLEALKMAQRFIAKVDALHNTIYVSGLDEKCQAAIAKAEAPHE
jgi:hydroxymethylpyrimidine/phosphomethylpyrimidine kinase